jgi:hypothetical protein
MVALVELDNLATSVVLQFSTLVAVAVAQASMD